MRHSWIAAAVLFALLIAFRALGSLGSLPNFSPLPALLLCSLVFFRGTRAWLLPLGAWALSDPLVSLLQGFPLLGFHHLGLLLGLAASAAIAIALRRHTGTWQLLAGSLAAALLFYLVTNTLSFFFDPLYPKSLAGFVQAQWTGPAGFGPTWVFLRNSLAANLLFTGLFLAARPAWLPTPAAAKTPEPSLR